MCHVSCCVSCVMCHMSHVTCCVSHVMSCHLMCHVVCHVSCVTYHVSLVTCHTSHVTCHIFGLSGKTSRWRVTADSPHLIGKFELICVGKLLTTHTFFLVKATATFWNPKYSKKCIGGLNVDLVYLNI